MRISDWSSDVCSSDLRRRASTGKPITSGHSTGSTHTRRPGSEGAMLTKRKAAQAGRTKLASLVAAAGAAPLDRRSFLDRKSVVSGKSVSVRVELGGRRIIKKKKRYNRTSYT